MKRILLATAALLAATQAQALQTLEYGWEDGTGTILGSYGNLVDATNVSGAQSGSTTVAGAHDGDAFLHVAEAPHDGTPQAYLAFVTGLSAGDVVSASFWGYDDTPGASPSLRIWAHYADASDIDAYAGSAGGNSTYTDGSGWSEVGYSWTMDGSADGLVIEARLYSTPASGAAEYTDFWIDDLSVTAPDHARIQFAAAPVPEPHSYALMLAGLGLIGGVAHRRLGH